MSALKKFCEVIQIFSWSRTGNFWMLFTNIVTKLIPICKSMFCPACASSELSHSIAFVHDISKFVKFIETISERMRVILDYFLQI